MKFVSLYVDRQSFVHRIDPITKIFYIVFAIALPIILPYYTVMFASVLLSVILLACAGVLKRAVPVYMLLAFVLVSIIIIQGLFGVHNETVLFTVFGIPYYKEGFLEGTKVVLRALDIVSSFLILVLTAKPDDLVEDLVRKGLSPRIGYVILSVFQIIPQMVSTVDTITDAQRSRGMETQGNLIVRIKAFIPLLGPVVLNSFMNTKERAMALEVRAFSASGPRTFLNKQKEFKYASFMRCTFIIILIVAVFWRVIA